MNKLQFKPHFQVEVVRPDTVYLLSEESAIALTGNLYCQLTPLLNGDRTVEEIIAQLKGVDPGSIYYAIDRLKAKNYLIENCVAKPCGKAYRQPRRVSAFWSSLNLDPEIAWQSLQQASVSITAYGDVSTEFLNTTLKSLGVRVRDDSIDDRDRFAVVVTDDYLRPELEKFNQQAVDAGISWLLVKPVGTKL